MIIKYYCDKSRGTQREDDFEMTTYVDVVKLVIRKIIAKSSTIL